jgi:prepilin-type N-terminal cleavage/methylation domain-containing protein
MLRTGHRLAVWERTRRRISAQCGFTAIELIVVMAVLLIILAPLAGSFVSALNAQVDQTRRFDAQENARQALDRMRKDIHCAHGVSDPYTNESGGETIVLTETNTTGTAECPGLLAQNASAVQWCTVAVAGAVDRYQLFRENDSASTCDGSAATFQVDFLTRSDLWCTPESVCDDPQPPACPTGQYPTVLVTLPVNVDPVKHAASTYTLNDRIALRNGTSCP